MKWWKMERAVVPDKEDEEGKAAIWEFAEKRMQWLQYNPGEAYKASLALHNIPIAPMGAGAEEAVQLRHFFQLGSIRHSRPRQRATFTFERVHSGSGGSPLCHQRRVPRARQEAGCWVHFGQLVWP